MSRGNYMEIRARPSGLIFVRKIRKDAYMETIISACISAAVTLLVCLISNHGNRRKLGHLWNIS